MCDVRCGALPLLLLQLTCGPRPSAPGAAPTAQATSRADTTVPSASSPEPTTTLPPASTTDGFHANRSTLTFPAKPRERALAENTFPNPLLSQAGALIGVENGTRIRKYATGEKQPEGELGTLAGVRALAADDARLYLGQDRGGGQGAVFQVPLSGGKIEQLFELGAVSALAVDQADLYVGVDRGGSLGSARLVRIALKQGLTEELAQGLTSIVAIAVDPTDAYLLVRGGVGPEGRSGALLRIAKRGGAVTTLTTLQSPVALAVDEKDVFVSDAGPATTRPSMKCAPGVPCPVATSNPVMLEGRVLRVTKADGALKVLAEKRENLGALVIDRESVIFGANGELFRVAKAGGTAKTWWAPQFGHAGAMAVDGKTVFVAAASGVVRLE